MLNLHRYKILINKLSFRYLSISKSDLISCSRNIEEIIKSAEDEKCSTLIWFSNSLNEIHKLYPSIKIGTSTKEIYQKDSSTLNSIYLKLENDRKNLNEKSYLNLIVLLRYIRYLQVAFIYRLITFDIHSTVKELTNSIIYLTKDENSFQKNEKLNFSSKSLICELTFFVNLLSSNNSLSDVKSLLSRTLIVNYLLNNLYSMLIKNECLLLINEICFTLNSIVEIPSSTNIDLWSYQLLKYLYENKTNSLLIIKYLILIEHSSINTKSSDKISLLNKYLNECAIDEQDLNMICEFLIFISSLNYSHQSFQMKINEKIENSLKENVLSDIKLCCRLIYYLCLNDPTNRFGSRSIVIQLSERINENLDEEIKSPQWIVQAQHGMMLSNVYNYQLLFQTVQHQFFPLLFRKFISFRIN
jgi:hypothetical protein